MDGRRDVHRPCSAIATAPGTMKQRLQTKLGQHLILTPQLRQALHLLQLPVLELEAEIAAALESNPLLDRDESAPLDVATDERHDGGEHREDDEQGDDVHEGS